MPPVEKIELSSAHTGRRTVAAICLLVLGVAALAYALTGWLAGRSGWQAVEASATGDASCAQEFILYYDLGAGEMSAAAEKKALARLYSDAAVNAYRLFSADEAFQGVNNLWYLNRHPNETVALDPALYDALATATASGDRSLYLGPVYEQYGGIFHCDDDSQTADFDPLQNESLRSYYAQCAAFARDGEAIELELMEDSRVRLKVSEAYMAFAQEQEIETFVDFFWMKNAFIADYLADVLTDGGFTRGALSSYDGFIRDLSGEGTFGLNIYDNSQGLSVQAAAMEYSGPISIVYLRDYPANSMDEGHYYTLADGQVRTAFVDAADGLARSAASDLVGYSRTLSCAQTLLALRPVYVAEALDEGALEALPAAGVEYVRCQDRQVLYSDPALKLYGLYDGEDGAYTARCTEQ